ncbi:MAG: Pycsar system effector family protein [Erythrobacter sp.]
MGVQETMEPAAHGGQSGAVGGALKEPRDKNPVVYNDYATGSAIHLVRNAQIQGLTLSRMADQKASILMGATFVVFSISVSQATSGNVPWSLTILAAFAFLSSLCAVVAVLPSTKKVDPGKITPNLLFFGHFTEMGEEEWTDQLVEELRSDETVFRMMLHDIYQNGQVLQNKKYRFLGLAYKIFTTGLVFTMINFVIEMSFKYGVLSLGE